MATIQGIYIALFGRPADPAGLAYWEAETKGGTDLSGLIGRLTQSDEYLDRFEGQSQEQIVTTIYQALFGREPDAAGLAFFVEALQSGSQTIETISINILDGARNTDATIIEHKQAAADLFTASLDTPEEIAAYTGDDAADAGRAFISHVTADPASVPTQAQVDQAIDQGVVNPPAEEPTQPEPGSGGGGGGGAPSGPEHIDSHVQLVVDRAAPASSSFQDGTLTLTIDPAKTQEGFERYQGVKITDGGDNYNVEHGAIFSATLKIEDAWALDDDGQLTGVWITMQNDEHTLPSGGVFSIAEYLDADAAEAITGAPDTFTGGFRFWNSEEGWDKYVNFDVSDLDSVKLTYEFAGSAHIWFINGEEVYRDTTAENIDSVDVIENVIFNSQNFGGDGETYTYTDISLVGTSAPQVENIA